MDNKKNRQLRTEVLDIEVFANENSNNLLHSILIIAISKLNFLHPILVV